MDDGVARVEQHPVVDRLALDARGAQACIAARPDDSIRDRADVGAGAAGRDDHEISQRGATYELDSDYILGLRVLKASHHDFGEGTFQRRQRWRKGYRGSAFHSRALRGAWGLLREAQRRILSFREGGEPNMIRSCADYKVRTTAK
jgi:hypothetical protein